MTYLGKADIFDADGKINAEDLPESPMGPSSNGLSAYELAVQNGFEGTIQVWLDSLHGQDGLNGINGIDGRTPIKDVDYFDGIDGTNGTNGYTPVKNIDYFDGIKGDKGDQGNQGNQGIQGQQGNQGIQGNPGQNGSDASVTKANVEAVLTGTISSHSHPNDHTNVFKTGITTRDINVVSGVVNVAHGLGRAPVGVRVTAFLVQTANTTHCIGVSSGTQHSGLCTIMTEGTTTATTDTTYSSVVFELGFSAATIVNPYTGANRQNCVITFDATNIIFTWTKTGTVASATANILWEAF